MLRPWSLLFIPALLITILVSNPDKLISYFSPQGTLTPESINADFDPADIQGIFNNQEVSVPAQLLAELTAPVYPPRQILGANSTNKRIEVDLTNQRLYAYESNQQVHNFLISSGKWGKTPTGSFQIWIKLRATKMSGGNKALRTYYYLPNVPYTMYFYGDSVPKYKGFGIHGAYWHNNFGHPMSHGCVNMKPEEAGVIFNWADPQPPEGKRSVQATTDNPGTPIVIYGKAPAS